MANQKEYGMESWKEQQKEQKKPDEMEERWEEPRGDQMVTHSGGLKVEPIGYEKEQKNP